MQECVLLRQECVLLRGIGVCCCVALGGVDPGGGAEEVRAEVEGHGCVQNLIGRLIGRLIDSVVTSLAPPPPPSSLSPLLSAPPPFTLSLPSPPPRRLRGTASREVRVEHGGAA